MIQAHGFRFIIVKMNVVAGANERRLYSQANFEQTTV